MRDDVTLKASRRSLFKVLKAQKVLSQILKWGWAELSILGKFSFGAEWAFQMIQ